MGVSGASPFIGFEAKLMILEETYHYSLVLVKQSAYLVPANLQANESVGNLFSTIWFHEPN